jgi:excisionase family DNA binding protein
VSIPLPGWPAREFLSIAELAAMLGVCNVTVWRWIRSGKLKATKAGHHWRIAKADALAFLGLAEADREAEIRAARERALALCRGER